MKNFICVLFTFFFLLPMSISSEEILVPVLANMGEGEGKAQDYFIVINTTSSTISAVWNIGEYWRTYYVNWGVLKYTHKGVYKQSDGSKVYLFSDKPVPSTLVINKLQGQYCILFEHPYNEYKYVYVQKIIKDGEIDDRGCYLGNSTEYAKAIKKVDRLFANLISNGSSSSEERNELPLLLDGHNSPFYSYIGGAQTKDLGRDGVLGHAISVRTKTGKLVEETSLGDYTITSDASWLSFPYKTNSGFCPIAEVNMTGKSRTAIVFVSAGGVSSKFYIKQSAVIASINKIWVEHNKWSGLTKGMKIHIKFNTYGVQGISGQCSAYFYFENGQKLQDYDGYYRTTDGQVSVYENFTPPYENTTYNDFVLFIPYQQLHISGHAECKFNIEIHINGQTVSTDYQHFTVK